MIRQVGLHPAPKSLRRARDSWGYWAGGIGLLMIFDALFFRTNLMSGSVGLVLMGIGILASFMTYFLTAGRCYRRIKSGLPCVCPECEYHNPTNETELDTLTCPECGITYTAEEVADLTSSFWRVFSSRGTRESSLWIKRESLAKSRRMLREYNDQLKQGSKSEPG